MSIREWVSRSAPWVALVGLLSAGCTVKSLIYPAPSIEVGEPPPGFEEVELSLGDDLRVIGWHHASPRPSDRPAMIFFHGNGENLETLKWSGLFDRLLSLQTTVLVVDYPGYGRSTGQPSETSLMTAAAGSLSWLQDTHPDRAVVPCGWSLGAALAVDLAAKDATGTVQGLIAISPWSSLQAVAEIHFPRWLVGVGLRERYDSLGVAGRIGVPALVMHGAGDRIIPVEQGRQLAAAIGGSTWIQIETAGHNDILGLSRVWQEIDDFVTALSDPAAL